MSDNSVEIKKYNNVSLKSLSAYQLLSQRENMCELFQLLDDSERHSHIVDTKNQQTALKYMQEQLAALKASK